MKRYLPFVIVVVVALATLGSGAMLYRAKRPQVKNIPESQGVAQEAMLRRMFEATPTLRLRLRVRRLPVPAVADNSPFLSRNC